MAETARARVRIAEAAAQPRWLLLGTLAAQPAPNRSVRHGDAMRLWLQPEQFLQLGGARPEHALTFDVGARWCGFDLTGAAAADLLACGCSLDFRDEAFPIGACAQSRIEQVPALIFRVAAAHWHVLVERPLAHHFRRWLQVAADEFRFNGDAT